MAWNRIADIVGAIEREDRGQGFQSWVGLDSRSWFLREEKEGKIGLPNLVSKNYRVLVKFEFQINNLRAKKIMHLQS